MVSAAVAGEHKLIQCVLPKGVALPTLKALRDAFGIVTANINNARGVGKLTPLAHRGIGAQSEKEILSVVVDAAVADRVFEFIYVQADINRPHGGLMIQLPLVRATQFELPDLPAEA